MVDLLVEGGHLDLVVEAADRRGDWFCARGAARELCTTEEFERAWAVMKPFADSGWLPALSAGADILVRWGRIDEALALVRPDETAWQAVEACRAYAEVLVKTGCVDEAITVLEPHLSDGRIPRSLVEMTEGQGRDDRVLALLVPLAQEARRVQTQGGSHRHWETLDLQAEVLERSGRVDEAISVLGTDVAARRYGPQNTVETYVGLLARHGRIEELHRAVTTGGHAREALRPLVGALQDAGRTGEAETLLRELIAATDYPGSCQSLLMDLLAGQDRIDEAVEVVRPTFEDPWEGLLYVAVRMLAENGLQERALRLLDECSQDFLEETYWVPSTRWWLMGETGRCREAIAEVAADPDLYADERDITIASLLAQDGRSDEAMELLRTHPGLTAATDLAKLLIRQNRPIDAIAAIPSAAAQREHARRRWSTPNSTEADSIDGPQL